MHVWGSSVLYVLYILYKFCTNFFIKIHSYFHADRVLYILPWVFVIYQYITARSTITFKELHFNAVLWFIDVDEHCRLRILATCIYSIEVHRLYLHLLVIYKCSPWDYWVKYRLSLPIKSKGRTINHTWNHYMGKDGKQTNASLHDSSEALIVSKS